MGETIARDLNRLVMNYLVIEGYKDAAEQFSLESGLEPTIDLESIQERMEIRHAIQSGDVDTAIELVNDVNPEVRKDKVSICIIMNTENGNDRFSMTTQSSFSICSNND